MDVLWAISGWITGQCEERLKSRIMMEAAIAMAVPGDENGGSKHGTIGAHGE